MIFLCSFQSESKSCYFSYLKETDRQEMSETTSEIYFNGEMRWKKSSERILFLQIEFIHDIQLYTSFLLSVYIYKHLPIFIVDTKGNFRSWSFCPWRWSLTLACWWSKKLVVVRREKNDTSIYTAAYLYHTKNK